MPEEKQSGDSKDKSTPATVEVDGKNYGEAEIKSMISEQASATQKAQDASAVLNACERLGIEPEQFLARSEGAFQVLNELVDKEIISNEGEIIVKKASEPKEPEGDPPKDPGKDPELKGDDRMLALIQKALGPVTDRLEGLEKDGVKVNRVLIQNRLQEIHPGLTGEDVNRILGAANVDKSKTILEHAKNYVETRASSEADLRAKHAKEFGVDLEKFDENKLKESESDGGASTLVEGKKVSFDKKDDAVTPREATEKYFDKVFD